MLKVHSIETFGTQEGPGIRLVIFLQGCNFRCVYCHNPDTQSLIGGNEMHTEEILKLLEKQKPYFKDKGGLTVSGGEPLVQRKALADVFKSVKQAGYHTAIDTNGSYIDNDSKELLKNTDLVLLCVKHIDSDWHHKVTGAPINSVLQFADYLEQTGKPIWLRYVLVPGYTDQQEFLHKWGERFANFKTVQRVEILPYHTFGAYKYKLLGVKNPLEGVSPPTQDKINEALNIFKNYFKQVYIR